MKEWGEKVRQKARKEKERKIEEDVVQKHIIKMLHSKI